MSNSLKAWPDLLHTTNSYSLSNWNSNPYAPKWHLLKPKQNCNFVSVRVPLAGYRPVTASRRCRCSHGHWCPLTCTWHMSKQVSPANLIQCLAHSPKREPKEKVYSSPWMSYLISKSWEPLSLSLWKIKSVDFTFPCRSPSTDLRAQGREVQILTGCGSWISSSPKHRLKYILLPFPPWPCLSTAASLHFSPQADLIL